MRELEESMYIISKSSYEKIYSSMVKPFRIISKEKSQRQKGVAGILNRLDNSVCLTFIDMMRTTAFDPARRFVIALILINPTDESKFLAVKRPPNAESLPNVWGLPAITLRYGEQPETAVLRLAKEKLNTQIKFLGC